MQKLLELAYHDGQDKELNVLHVGECWHIQFQYEHVGRSNYFVEAATSQISKIKYNPRTDQWLGFERPEPGQPEQVIKLDYKWVKVNFRKEQIAHLKSIAEDEYKKFVKLPIEDIIEVVPTMNIGGNPPIKYQNNDSGICAYASLASLLAFKGYHQEAEAIMDLSKEVNCNALYQFDALLRIIQFIDKEKRHIKFTN